MVGFPCGIAVGVPPLGGVRSQSFRLKAGLQRRSIRSLPDSIQEIAVPPATTHERAVEKADVLIEALGWIRRFRDKITVIKLGGSVMENQAALQHLLLDLVFMETVGMRVVVVHGGGAAITRAMDTAGIQPRFIQGRRYTDDATRDIVERVLAY